MIKSFGTHDLDSREDKKALAKAKAELKYMIAFEEYTKDFKSFEDFILYTAKDLTL